MNKKTPITAIILTFNEEIHIERCIESVKEIASQILIIDSHSTDKTLEIAIKCGATVFQNKFINQAKQFQWALDNCDIEGDWILRLDADEYLTTPLINEISTKFRTIQDSFTGVYLKRQVHFMGKWIKHGGYYPIKLLRLWKKGVGSIEQKWMDEHVKLAYGNTTEFENDFVDDNLQNLSWWIQKHNNYATREAIEYLNSKYNLFEKDSIALDSKTQEASKRKIKENVYNKIPLFFRAFLYFNYRFWFKFGFLDGKEGFIWHVLQGFWYRFLVDSKIVQIKYLAAKKNKTIAQILSDDFGFNL